MPNNQEFYSALNLNKEASFKEIKESYIKLSRILHPDKQQLFHKKSSEKAFDRIRYYKDVLLNPTTRFIYDNFGEDGLELIKKKDYLLHYPVHTETDKKVLFIQALIEKLQYLLQRSRQDHFINEVNTRTRISLSLSCMDYFSSYGEHNKATFWQRK